MKANGSQPLFTDAPVPVGINIEGHDLDVTPSVANPHDSVVEVARAVGRAMQEALLVHRLNYSARVINVVIVSMLLYSLGYSVAWVRRGFAAERP